MEASLHALRAGEPARSLFLIFTSHNFEGFDQVSSSSGRERGKS